MAADKEGTDEALERLRQSAGRAAQQAAAGATSDTLAAILERLDALEARIEGGEEIHRLAQEIRKYVSDKRRELKVLRLWRTAAILAAAVFSGAVIINYVVEAYLGFPAIVALSEGASIPVAAFIGVSFGSVLALLLVVLRGIFHSIDKAEGDSYLPPHISELWEAIKKLKG